jgi:WD40 repeat protein
MIKVICPNPQCGAHLEFRGPGRYRCPRCFADVAVGLGDVDEAAPVLAAEDLPDLIVPPGVALHALFIVALLAAVDLVAALLLWTRPGLNYRPPSYSLQALVFSPGGDTITGHSFGTVKVWEATTGHEISSVTCEGTNPLLSPDGKWLFTTNLAPREHIVWDASTGQRVFTFQTKSDVDHGVAFSPDGKWLAHRSSNDQNQYAVRDVPDGNLLATIMFGYPSRISPDGKQIAIAGSSWKGPFVTLWDPFKGRPEVTIYPDRHIHLMAFSADSRRVALVVDGQLQVWDVKTGAKLESFPCAVGGISQVVVGRNGVLVMRNEAVRPGSAGWWDARRNAPLVEFGAGGQGWVTACNSDGTRIAGRAVGENAIKIWDAATGRDVATLEGNPPPLHGLVFSPDGTRLAGWKDDKTDRSRVKVFVWETATGRQLVAFNGYDAPFLDSQGVWGVGVLAVIAAGGLLCLWWCRPRRDHEPELLAGDGMNWQEES